jgi:hypothetical protein
LTKPSEQVGKWAWLREEEGVLARADPADTKIAASNRANVFIFLLPRFFSLNSLSKVGLTSFACKIILIGAFVSLRLEGWLA